MCDVCRGLPVSLTTVVMPSQEAALHPGQSHGCLGPERRPECSRHVQWAVGAIALFLYKHKYKLRFL